MSSHESPKNALACSVAVLRNVVVIDGLALHAPTAVTETSFCPWVNPSSATAS